MILVQRAATPDSSSSDRAQAANHFRGQCPIPCPVVPVLSRCVGAGTPAVDRRPPFDLGRCVVVRGGGTVHPAIPDLRRTYGSVYARFDAGFTFRFRWVRVRFSWDPYRISTDFRIRTGFRTQVE